MSHYSVGVILKKEVVDQIGIDNAVAEALEPFDEGLEVEEYPQATIEEAMEKYQEFKKAAETGESDYYNVKYIKEIEKDGHLNSLDAFIKHWYGSDNDDGSETRTPEGIPYTTYNPNSKWDWYVIGGRWNEMIDDNSCLIKDLQLKKELSDEERERLTKRYAAITTNSEDLTEEQKELLKDDFFLYKAEYYRQSYPTLEDYLDARTSLSTYSVLTADGDWIEPGKMGWFGRSHATPIQEHTFYKVFADIIQKADKEDTFVVVDCHI